MEKTIRFDGNLDSYESFFDFEWAENLGRISQNTKLDSPAFELSASWRGIGNVRRMPWLMVKSIKDFGESLLQSKMPFPIEVMKGVVERVSSMSENNYFRHVSSTQRRILVNIIDNIQEETMEKLQENPITIDKEEFWKGFLQSPEIPITLWMSEMTAYAGVYFAYEAFLIKSMKIALNMDSLRTTGKPERRLDCKLEETFNADMVQQ